MYWGICHVRILDDLANRIKEAEQRVSVDSIYTHYSDAEKLYKVLAVAILEETEEPCVVYQALYGNGLIWVRYVSAWCARVIHNGQSVTRFIRKHADISSIK